ncbi:septum formation initiator family protein [Tissierella sp. MB52-C2]|uniref:FtsB family cell division protein n=1 Tax=Tissierella sp. MB52-C2 TaxID=3070999 RepID=UPI00280ADCBE|nr:septum formation initiator family protein [Tissierella sp. MB52-C2]WMM25412.1 septum formation initiator family protein [Tissierella sp. MB52-C2]
MQKKKKKKKISLINLIVYSLFIYVGLIFWNQRDLMKNLEAKQIEVQKEVQTLEKEIDILNKEIEDSDSLQFVEKVARDDLGMVKPREIIYIDQNRKKNPFLNPIKKRTN